MLIIAAAFLGLIVMLLWNALIPDLFHGPHLDYLQAVGLLVLSRVLVGIRGGHRRGWRPWKHWGRNKNGGNGPKHEWKYNINLGPNCRDEWWHKFAGMSPEARRKAKEEWRSSKEDWKREFKQSFNKPSEPRPGAEIHP